ncbi:hypothetical protein [Anditalea andensis]|uniref:Uncharacterized protein n=1 Tax=Anditalea andensis TaxID=1048983 RepID=A0A074KX81_9BACT|nr:hypothetical protein [Anditalea andensis]KEO72213.1 hypothetical protein EL17_20130 [Anditalea andensis]
MLDFNRIFNESKVRVHTPTASPLFTGPGFGGRQDGFKTLCGQNKRSIHFLTGGYTPGYAITPRWGCSGTGVFYNNSWDNTSSSTTAAFL